MQQFPDRILRSAGTLASTLAMLTAAQASQGPGVGPGSAGVLGQTAGIAILAAMLAVVGLAVVKLAARRGSGIR